jgi:hypothetical protein
MDILLAELTFYIHRNVLFYSYSVYLLQERKLVHSKPHICFCEEVLLGNKSFRCVQFFYLEAKYCKQSKGRRWEKSAVHCEMIHEVIKGTQFTLY